MRVKKMISLNIKKGETVTIPSGEFWKGVLINAAPVSDSAQLTVNGVSVKYSGGISHRFEFTQNTVIVSINDNRSFDCVLQGLAFEL